MKGNFKKIIAILIVLLIVMIGIFISNKLTSQKTVHGNKTISITIEDKVADKVLLENKVFHTNATTLDEFLTENKDYLKVDIVKKTPYGSYLLGLYGLKTTNMNKGPWWIYSYSAPAERIDFKLGSAPAIDKLNLAKNSSVTFVFTNSF